MPKKLVSIAPYSGTITHTSDAHNSAVTVYASAINAHNHDPSDTVGNYGEAIPAWGPNNTLYSLHGPGGAGPGNDWYSAYSGQAAIPADPSETAVSPLTGLIIQQQASPSPIAQAHGIQGHIQRLYGAFALLKSVSVVSSTVQASPAPTANTFAVPTAIATQLRTGVGISVAAQVGTVSTINTGTGVVTLTANLGTVPVAGQTVTQATGNWWDNVQAALLGSAPMAGNLTLDSAHAVTAGQLISNVASGTPPLLITSPTHVANLNVDAVDGYSAWATSVGSAGGLMPAPTPTPSTQLAAGGTLTVGTTYTYQVSDTTSGGETPLSAPTTGQTPTSLNRSITLTGIPVGSPNVTGRKIYRLANGVMEGVVQTLADNTTTTWTDSGAVAGGGPPGSTTANYGALLPALDGNGYLPPGWVEYDSAEAITWDTLVAGQSSLVNTLNRIRNQINAMIVAAGALGWGAPPATLVQAISVLGHPVGGIVNFQSAGNTHIAITGNTITISS